MRTIYIDSDYVCHAENAPGRTAVETDILDNVCDYALPFYIFAPAHSDKVDFVQCINSKVADIVQAQYEKMLAERADMQAALDAIYGGVTDE